MVGDARERGGADDRGRALVQLLFDRDLDFGEVVVGQLDALDRADGLAADQDLVVGARAGWRSGRGGCTGGRCCRRGAIAARAITTIARAAIAATRAGVESPALGRASLLASWVSSHGSSLAAPSASESEGTARRIVSEPSPCQRRPAGDLTGIQRAISAPGSSLGPRSDVEPRQGAVQPPRQPPDPVADQQHQRRQEDDADDGRVEQHRDGQTDSRAG